MSRQYLLPVLLSFLSGGLAGAGASRIITEPRLTALEVTVEHIADDVTWIRDHMEIR